MENGEQLPRPSSSSSTSSSSCFVSGDEWEVEYSRFFNFPLPSSQHYHPDLRPLSKCKARFGGSWITASSLTLLRLRSSSASSPVVLSVSVPGLLYEEHFISNLHISLPRPSSASQCSADGSRSTLLSFRDCSNQIQKFALRFSTHREVQTFLDNIKQHSRNVMEVGFSDFACENSPSSLRVSPNLIQYRLENPSYGRDDGGSNVGERLCALTFNDMPSDCPHPTSRDEGSNVVEPLCALTVNDMPSGCSQPQLLPDAGSTISPALPPSFTDFLMNCSGNRHEEQSKPEIGGNGIPSVNELSLLDCLANASVSEMVNALVQPIPGSKLNAELAKYASSASFHDMLAKIEGVIAELGDDMSL